MDTISKFCLNRANCARCPGCLLCICHQATQDVVRQVLASGVRIGAK